MQRKKLRHADALTYNMLPKRLFDADLQSDRQVRVSGVIVHACCR